MLKRENYYEIISFVRYKEETGLTISNPQPRGYNDWIQEDVTRSLSFYIEQISTRGNSKHQKKIEFLGSIEEIFQMQILYGI